MSDKLTVNDLNVMRHEIKKIELNPKKSGYHVNVKILIDKVEVFQVPAIQAGCSLLWESTWAYDIWKETEITIQIHKEPRWWSIGSKAHVLSVEYVVWNEENEHAETIKSDSDKYTVTVTCATRQLDEGEAEKFLAATMREAESVERQLKNRDLHRVRKVITTVLDPRGGKIEGIVGFYRIVGLFKKSHAWKEKLRVLMAGSPTSSMGPSTKDMGAIEFLASVEDDLHNKVFLIYNKKHSTGVKVDKDAHGESLKGSITTEENTDGRKWRFERCDSPGSKWYKICPTGYPGKYVSPDSTPADQGISITGTETWWMLEPMADTTYCYKISDIEQQLCWRQESKRVGTPVKLDKYVLDDPAVYWDFKLVQE